MENNMEEIWKPVRGFEEYAEISNYGQIHRFERTYYSGKGYKTKRIQEENWTYGSETPYGYLYASIGNVSKGVHVWVYETFYNCDVPKGYDVNHIDENKKNNRLDNLNLMTPKENSNWGTGIERSAAARRGRKRSAEVGAKIAAAQKNDTKKSKAVQALDPKTKEVVMEFASTQEAQRQGFFASAVSACCRNCYSCPGNNVYKGLIWKFRLPQ